MITVILPTGNTNNLSPLTDLISESMLPIANKPILEHQIELLAQHGIKEILIVLKHKPKEVIDYFGSGEKWGVELHFINIRQFLGCVNAFQQIHLQWKGPFLCMPGHVITNFDVTQFLKVHKNGKNDLTLCSENGASHKKINFSLNDNFLRKSPFIIEEELLSKMLKQQNEMVPHSESTSLMPEINIFNCKPSVRFCYLDSPKDYWETTRLALEKKIDGLILAGKEISSGIWIGAHSEIHPRAILKPPLMIGDHCDINKNAVLENGSVIGDHSIIDEGTFVARSIIWKGTYVGPQTQITNSVVSKKLLFNIPRKTKIEISESFILGNSEPDLHFSNKKSHKKSNSLKPIRIFFILLTRFINKLICRYYFNKANLKLKKIEL